MAEFSFEDLLTWSVRLPMWQRDALRRVVLGKITEADVNDLTAMAKAAVALPVPAQLPNPAARNHIRLSATASVPVALVALREIKYVNALASGPISFAPEGLTVVYGDNASGKSGIARILKKAGRAREPGGLIRPSVHEPDPRQPATAMIEFRVKGEDRSFAWSDGAATHDDLTRINIFDADCAAAQIEESNRLAYTPEILQIFQDLAETCRAVGIKLKAERDALENGRSPHLAVLALRPQTAGGSLFASLSPQTDTKQIDALCNVSAEERHRFKTLTEALRDNPTSQADLLQAHDRQLRQIEDLAAAVEALLSDVAAHEFEKEIEHADAAAEAARAARESFATNSALAGLGSEAWTELWESARRYSAQFAYPGERFPVTRDEAFCVLCQQPIKAPAASRLASFEEFVRDDVQQRASQARRTVVARKTTIENLRIPMSGVSTRNAALGGTGVERGVKTLIVTAKLRRRYLLRKIAGRNVYRPSLLPARPDLSASRRSLAEQIRQFRDAAVAQERRKMQDELAELDDRIKLSPFRDTLKNEVARLMYCSLLDRARTDCDTTWITRKGGEVAQLVVTARLRSAFATNLIKLGFSAAPVEIKLGQGTVGQHPYDLSLIARPDVPASEVLSEGGENVRSTLWVSS